MAVVRQFKHSLEPSVVGVTSRWANFQAIANMGSSKISKQGKRCLPTPKGPSRSCGYWKRLCNYFFTVSEREQPSDYKRIFRNLTKAWGSYLMRVSMAHPPRMSSHSNTSSEWVWNEYPQRRTSLVWCHTCAPGAKCMQCRSYLQRLWNGKAAEVPWG